MSKTKWGAFYSAVIFIDVFQFILTFLVVGAVLNTGIDIVVGLLLPFFLHLCGVNMTDPKRIAAIFAAFGLELFPVLNALPLWTLDLILIHAMSKGEAKLKENAPSVMRSLEKVSRAGQKMYGPLNKDGVRLPSGRDTI